MSCEVSTSQRRLAAFTCTLILTATELLSGCGLSSSTPKPLLSNNGDPEPALVAKACAGRTAADGPDPSLNSGGLKTPQNPEVSKCRQAIEDIQELRNRQLISPRLSEILFSQIIPHELFEQSEQLKQVPLEFRKEVEPETVIKMAEEISRINSISGKLALNDPVHMRIAVTVGFFTEGGVPGVEKYLKRIYQEEWWPSDFLDRHIDTEKAYSLAWLDENVGFFDIDDRKLLNLDEKVDRAKSTAGTYFRLEEEKALLINLTQLLALENLLGLTSKGEGGYNSSNGGTSGNQIQGSTHDGKGVSGKSVDQLTIKEVIDDNSLFAVGRYQITHETLKHILKLLSQTDHQNYFQKVLKIDLSQINDSLVLTRKNQDLLGLILVMEKAGDYLTENNGDKHLQAAHLRLAESWASLPFNGGSVYGKPNEAHPSITDDCVRKALKAAKWAYRLGWNALKSPLKQSSIRPLPRPAKYPTEFHHS